MAVQRWLAAMGWFIIKFFRTGNCFTGGEHSPLPLSASASAVLVHVDVRPPAVDAVLLPGLPDAVVLHSILPLVSWHARPHLRATSRAWVFALDNLSIEDRLLARTLSQQFGNKELDDTDGRVRVKHVKDYEYAIQLYDPILEIWHNLPPLPCSSFPPTPVMAGFLTSQRVNNVMVDYLLGKMVAASVQGPNEDDCVIYVWTIDIKGGMWKWEERRRVSLRLKDRNVCANIVDLEGKLYILRHGKYDFMKPTVYDVASDEWVEILETPIWPGRGYIFTKYSTDMKTDPKTGKRTKLVYVNGPGKSFADLDPVTHTWFYTELIE